MKALFALAIVATMGLVACNQELTEPQKELVRLRTKCANNSDTSKECVDFRALQESQRSGG